MLFAFSLARATHLEDPKIEWWSFGQIISGYYLRISTSQPALFHSKQKQEPWGTDTALVV